MRDQEGKPSPSEEVFKRNFGWNEISVMKLLRNFKEGDLVEIVFQEGVPWVVGVKTSSE